MSVELIEKENTQLSVFTPLDALFGEYRKKRSDIERISAFVLNESCVMHYFQDASRVANDNVYVPSMSFSAGPAIRSLDAEFWSRAMALTDVLEAMDAGKRNEWNEQIRKNTTTPFVPEDVIDTIRSLLAQRSHFLAQRVDGLFRSLSGEHVTNSPAAFAKKMIINYMLGASDSLSHERAEYVHDLRCVIGKFVGRAVPNSGITYSALYDIVRNKEFGEWHEFDGGAWRVKIFMKGTAHLEIHPDMAWRLNSILASLYPMAIPESFRRKPVKSARAKEYDMHHDLVPFVAMAAIQKGRVNDEGSQISFTDPVCKEASDVLSRIGGVPNGRANWFFDYNIRPVLTSLYRMGRLPDQKTHQFYGTQASMAERVVEMAEVEESHTVLEPEAGQGGLADYLPNKANITCVEISQLHCDILRSKGYPKVCCGDFLSWNRDTRNFIERFDRIVLNPPFSEGRAKSHLYHAVKMLNPDGILVAILPASMKDQILVSNMQHEWSETITGAFEDTGVSVSILKLYK